MNTFGRIARTAALLGIASLAVAGCSDRVVEPSPKAARRTPLLEMAATPLSVQTIVVNPWQSQSYALNGIHNVYFQAGSVCDPELSSYGPGTWDEPCTPISHSITVTATTFADSAGNPYVDFQPALRFAPDKYVVLYMRDSDVPSTFDPQAIYYCFDSAVCVDETNADSSLVTYYDRDRALYFRRVKHFSGYVIGPSRLAVDAVLDSTITLGF